ncbi:MAG: PQQ-dependent sugar dehydrogenase [Verrucomicrobia bacterium]|nr:PQQ-dependent sugar dehydrogenase [Verrucomicrobiota bacterium]
MNSLSRQRLCVALSLAAVSLSAFAAEGRSGVALKLIATNLTAPSILTDFDGGRVLVAEQVGPVHLMTPDGQLRPFADFTSKLKINVGKFDERGVLGIALHPKFAANRKFYVCYSAEKRAGVPAVWDHTMNISEFTAQGDSADLGTERVVLQVDQPYFNHNGGRIAFGPDGFLYLGVGDGGHKNDINKEDADMARGPHGNGQDLNTLLGKIVRIDVDKPAAGKPYGIPLDNPFAKGGGLPEIYAWGIRNPWGMSFDRGGKRELFEVEVGQSRWEEVNIIVKGGNYGWNLREGAEWFNPKKELAPLDKPYFDPGPARFVDPILVYGNLAAFPTNGQGKSVTGGYVYRGKALPQLTGKYIFADWSRHFSLPQGVLFTGTRGADGKWTLAQLEPESHAGQHIAAFVWAFGEDKDGELYVLTNQSGALGNKSGKIWKLVKSAP